MHWTYRNKYLKIMVNFVNNELTGSEFDNQFRTLYRRTEEESKQIFTDMEKI